MKKIAPAKHLTIRELKAFEAMYHSLKSFPGFNMDNVFTHRTREHFAITKQVPTQLWRLFGCQSSKLSLAAHEAGHAVVITASGTMVEEVIIKADIKGFSGYVKPYGALDSDEEYTLVETAPVPCKPLIYIDVLRAVSGFVAEGTFTNTHPHQYHEKFSTFVQLRYLDELYESPQFYHWNYVMAWCENILKKNESAFHEIVADLLLHKTLSREFLNKLHQDIKREPADLFFN